MGKVNVYYPGQVEIADLYTACMVAMLRHAEKLPMSPVEVAAFTGAHAVLAAHLTMLTDQAVGNWKREILRALDEIRKERESDGGHRESNPPDTRGNGQHHT